MNSNIDPVKKVLLIEIDLLYMPRLMLRKIVTFLGLFLMNYSVSLGQSYNLRGSARALGGDCYQITPDSFGQIGAVWYTKKINVAASFDLEFTVNLGQNDANGADGMVFVLQTRGNTAIGQPGQGIGFKGFSPSLGIEFDTYQNGDEGDPAYDHIAVVRDGVVNHLGAYNLAGPVQALASNPNIEDGKDHLVRISWEASRKLLEVYIDCAKRISTTIEMRTIFGNQKEVFWGFTGATGGSSNTQVVCLKKDIVAQDTFRVCRGESLQLVARNSIDNKYNWTPASLLDNATSRSPTLRPAQSQLFIVDYRDFCNELTRDSVYVKVDLLPPLDLGGDRYACIPDTMQLDETVVGASGPVSYRWSTGDTTSSLSVSSSGTYSLIAAVGACVNSDSLILDFRTRPSLPSFYRPVSSCVFEEPITLTSVAGGSGLTYKWAHSGESTASVVISQPGNFELAVTNDSGCESKESFVVKDDCSLPLWIPDAFSPNADGQNDIFGMYSPVGLELRLWIYNRWGSVVFYSESQDNTWDGYYEGVMSPPDSYAWKIEYRPKRKREDPFESKAGVVWILQ
jgi:gliding motility-associated-like protein